MKIRSLNTLKLAASAGIILGMAFTAPSARAQASPETRSPGKSPAEASKDATTRFLKEAAADNALEVAMAEVAVRKAQNEQVKTFAQQLQQDHQAANQQLEPIARKHGVTVNEPLPRHEQRELTRLEKQSAGAKFDQKYVTEMLREHQKDVAKFEKAASEVQDPEVKQYIDTMLPKLRQHFQHAVTVARAVGVDESTISSISKRMPPAVGGSEDAGSDATQGHGAKHLHEGHSSGGSDD